MLRLIVNHIGNVYFFGALICAITMSTAHGNESWTLYKSNKWLEIHYKKLPNGLLQVKGQARLSGAVTKSVIHALTDTESIPTWVSNVRSVTVLAQPEPNQSLVYTKLNLPWPVADREMLTLSCFSQEEENKYVLKIRSAASGSRAKSDLQVTDVDIKWTFLEYASDLHITYTAQARLNGSVPNWIANIASLKNTRNMLQSLRKKLSESPDVLSEWTLPPGDCDGF
ncbi:hypothetical protein A7985_15405 [Pseudoalteromonas luteoviolacea]|uniref:START domain-containing protein n=1 Tax=Pseudoalteromonas luteoviolacea TaxID=43657 RepID=A0A1C0TNJ0_9GAMM|nr:START domain-containing protein [Pseudoalteromonas luteoviolacea]MBQ4813031.1 hypothetical protein [Pseudoalteromonas luteoviolacea]OCQ20444.1 hypothetical protein A7985_15405 [Pseudoalteromonas luteoviolacea]